MQEFTDKIRAAIAERSGLAEADVTGIFDRQETQQAQAARLDRAMRERELREGAPSVGGLDGLDEVRHALCDINYMIGQAFAVICFAT